MHAVLLLTGSMQCPGTTKHMCPGVNLHLLMVHIYLPTDGLLSFAGKSTLTDSLVAAAGIIAMENVRFLLPPL